MCEQSWRLIACAFMARGILIVDDNPSIRYLLRVLVETKTTFQVCGEAGHGMDAIEQAKQLQPDLVLLDLSMPIMNGAEAAVILKRTMPQMKIILFTMHSDNVGKALAAAVGVDLTLSKTDGLLKLEDHLKTLLSPASKAPRLTTGADQTLSGATTKSLPESD
jgi:DNA-binding NarL/FixJ family response regulator